MNVNIYNCRIISRDEKHIVIDNLKKKNSGLYIFQTNLEKGKYVLNYDIDNLDSSFNLFIRHKHTRIVYNKNYSKNCIYFNFNKNIFHLSLGFLTKNNGFCKNLIVKNITLKKCVEPDIKYYFNEYLIRKLNTSSVNDLVSILMTTYNSEQYLEKAIKSVLNQTYKNWELIIIDDYSTDKTRSIINKYILNEKRIKYIENNMNYGTYYSLNEGLKLSKGDFITKLDSDDFYHVNKIKNQLFYCIENSLECCSCNIIRFKNLPSIKTNLIFENVNSSIMFSRKVFEKIGYYDNCRFECDSDFYHRVKKNFKLVHLNENLYYSLIRENSLTTNYFTGVSFKSIGNKIRSEFRNKYSKYNQKYIKHPKFLRNYELHPILLCPIEIKLTGNYKILKETDTLNLEILDEFIYGFITYKLSVNKCLLKNPEKYEVEILYLNGKKVLKSSNDEIIFNSKEKYISVKIKINKGYCQYKPMILNPY